MKLVPLLLFFTVVFGLNAQNVNSLYGLENATPGTFNFVEYDLVNGNINFLETAPINSYTVPGTSACSDFVNGLYHLSTGSEIYSFTMNGNTPYSTTQLPVVGNALFINIEFDVCDSVFIGVHNIAPGNAWFAKFDPNANTITNFAQVPAGTFYLGGAMGEFDANTRMYYLQTANSIFAVNVDSGTIVHNNTVQTLTGMSGAGHFAYDCQTQRLIGTIVGTNDKGLTGKFLCILDATTGDLSLFSNTPTSAGQLKPLLGGSAFHLTSNSFYWAGAGGVIVGGDGTSGNINFDQQFSPSGEVILLESPTGCACNSPTGIGSFQQAKALLYPNPAKDVVFISALKVGSAYQLVNSYGAIVATGSYSENGISTAGIAAGSYVVRTSGSAFKLLIE